MFLTKYYREDFLFAKARYHLFELHYSKRSPQIEMLFNYLFAAFWILQYPEKILSVNLPIEAYLKVPEIIKHYNYPCEIHTTLTTDGYYLETHRIPNYKALENEVKPVLIIHGIFLGSFAWTLNKPNNSLAFLLYDDGYDVWMNNFRGSSYSRKHVKPNISEKEYWDFDFTATKDDVQNLIDYVLNVTKQDSLILVTYSIGNVASFMLLSTKLEYNKKVKGIVSLTPMSTGKNLRGTSFVVASIFGPVASFFEFLGIYHFFPLAEPGFKICRQIPIICRITNFLFESNISPNLDPTQLPTIYSHFPEPTSSKLIHHMLQVVYSQNFTGYNYGRSGNLKKYNSIWPPYYDVRKVTPNIIFLYGTMDNIGTSQGAKALSKLLPNFKRMEAIPCNHEDFAFAKNYSNLIYKPILKAIEELLAY